MAAGIVREVGAVVVREFVLLEKHGEEQ